MIITAPSAEMAATYQSFLASPSTSVLAPNASINYITTTTTISEPTAILKHLQSQGRQVVKKEENILNAIEGANGLCLETDTTLQFKNGGGAFLPGMDENVIDECIVTFPLIHAVSFDAGGKISQIRLYWDQGTLLKQVEAIGRTGRNWPIREGKKLIEAVKASVNATGQASNGSAARGQQNVVANHHKRDESVSATRDPHASLALFAPRDPNEDSGSAYNGPTVAPRPSAKPAPRDYGDLFVGEETSASSHRSTSPAKIDGRAVKGGAGKYVSGNRLFDENDHDSHSTPVGKKTYQQKYDHFAFGNGEDAPKDSRPNSGKDNRKSQATFSFEDFATPPKVNEKNKPDFERHWGAGVDEDDPESPPKRNIVHPPRKDHEKHYEIADDSPAGAMKMRPTTTNVDAARRGNDFASKHEFTDASPASVKENIRPPRQSARGELEPSWSTADSPPKPRKIYNTAGDGMGGRKGAFNPILGETEKKIYNTAGDGMGGRKGDYNPILGEEQKKIYVTAGDGMGGRKASGRTWGFGDDSDPEVEAERRTSMRGRRAQAGSGADR